MTFLKNRFEKLQARHPEATCGNRVLAVRFPGVVPTIFFAFLSDKLQATSQLAIKNVSGGGILVERLWDSSAPKVTTVSRKKRV
jgi:hypothetical protein